MEGWTKPVSERKYEEPVLYLVILSFASRAANTLWWEDKVVVVILVYWGNYDKRNNSSNDNKQRETAEGVSGHGSGGGCLSFK
jgi:hypothetical protein